jgi:hypothetical protein
MLQEFLWERKRFFAPIVTKAPPPPVLLILIESASRGDSLTFPCIFAYIWSSGAPN